MLVGPVAGRVLLLCFLLGLAHSSPVLWWGDGGSRRGGGSRCLLPRGV